MPFFRDKKESRELQVSIFENISGASSVFFFRNEKESWVHLVYCFQEWEKISGRPVSFFQEWERISGARSVWMKKNFGNEHLLYFFEEWKRISGASFVYLFSETRKNLEDTWCIFFQKEKESRGSLVSFFFRNKKESRRPQMPFFQEWGRIGGFSQEWK